MITYTDPNVCQREIKKWDTKEKKLVTENLNTGGQVLKGTSFVDYLDKTIEGNRKAASDNKYRIIREELIKVDWPGRKAQGSWESVKKLLSQPWPKALDLINWYVDEVSKYPLPEPHSILRKMKWNDDEGEICIDKTMQGEQEIYRKGFRHKVKGPSQIVLLTNLDNPWLVNKSGIFYRSIATIVLADILESKGYGVEIWAWCAGAKVFTGPDHHQFNCLQIKKSDQPIDKETLANVLSSWFTYYVIWGSWNACHVPPKSVGYAIYADDKTNTSFDCYLPHKQTDKELVNMFKNIEPDESQSQTYLVPHISAGWNWNYELNKMDSVKDGNVKGQGMAARIAGCCAEILQLIINRESESLS